MGGRRKENAQASETAGSTGHFAKTLAVLFAVPDALWATLALAIIGFVGLTATFNKVARDKTLDKAVWAVDALGILYAACLVFLH